MGKLADIQHGFRKGRSTIMNLLLFNEYITSSLERSEQVDSIFINFAKAFDVVNHMTLLQRARNFDIKGNICMWLQSYLSGRTQAVRLNGRISPFINATSGVPQDSHLGPILFIMFIKSLPSCVQFAKCSLYDNKLFFKFSNAADCSKLQKDLNSLVSWSVVNGLPISIPKYHALPCCRSRSPISYQYTRNNQSVSRMDLDSDLDTTFDSKNSFELHIDNQIAAAMILVGFVKCTTVDFRNPYCILYS